MSVFSGPCSIHKHDIGAHSCVQFLVQRADANPHSSHGWDTQPALLVFHIQKCGRSLLSVRLHLISAVRESHNWLAIRWRVQFNILILDSTFLTGFGDQSISSVIDYQKPHPLGR